MKPWPRLPLTLSGKVLDATAPYIISASRATDIPAFYGEWLISQFSRGYTYWRNPFNNKKQLISLANCRLLILWTKNAEAFLPSISYFQERGIELLFLYSLNNYDAESFEPGLPPLERRIKTFITLSERIGRERVHWRFDPLLLADSIDTEVLVERLRKVGEALSPHTKRLICSFIKIERYSRVAHNIRREQKTIRELCLEEKDHVIDQIQKLCCDKWKLTLSMCGTKEDYSHLGVSNQACIDYSEIVRLFSKDQLLMEFLEYRGASLFAGDEASLYAMPPKLKSSGQQPHCNCVMSKDIGFYNSCPHGCIYCYANISHSSAKARFKHLKGQAALGEELDV